MPTFDELDALIAEAQESLGGAVGFIYLRGLAFRLTDALSALRDTNPDENAEPEWDWSYSRGGIVQHTTGMPESEARGYAERLEPKGAYTVIRRRAAGPWLPVPSSPEGSKK